MKLKIYTLFLCLFATGMLWWACNTDNGDNINKPSSGDFFISRPEGGEVITDEWGGEIGYITVRYKTERYEEIVDFYDDYTRESSWNRSEAGQGEVLTINYLNLMAGFNISIGPPDGQIAGAFLVTLTAS